MTNATPAEFIVDLTPSGAVTARHFASAAAAAPLLVLAHGAGADQRHRRVVDMARRVSARGVDVATFNFLYTERTQTLNWPTWVVYLTLPIFAVSMTVHGLANLLEDLELVPRTPPKGFQLSELDGVN